MEINDSVDFLEKLFFSVSSARNELDRLRKDAVFSKSRILDLEKKLASEKEKLSNVIKYKNWYELVSPYSTVEVCPECDGAGGFTWDTPDGTEGQECPMCQGRCVVNKSNIALLAVGAKSEEGSSKQEF